jgi:hypothetical protein
MCRSVLFVEFLKKIYLVTGPLKKGIFSVKVTLFFCKSKDDVLHLHARGQVNEDPAALLRRIT